MLGIVQGFVAMVLSGWWLMGFVNGWLLWIMCIMLCMLLDNFYAFFGYICVVHLCGAFLSPGIGIKNQKQK